MKKLKKLGATIGILFVLITGFALFTESVYPNQYVMIKQFGAVVKVVDSPGLVVTIPFIQNTLSIPKNKLLYDLKPSSMNTADKKVMVVDSFALWRITDPLKYLSTLGASQTNAESRISTTVYNSVKTVISATTQDEIISGRDGELASLITANIGDKLDAYGIKVENVETKMLDLPESNKDSVFKRMISERNNIAAGYTSKGLSESEIIKNGTDKSVTVLVSEAKSAAEKTKAEGEQEYMRILSAVYNDASKADFYNFVRSLDALKLSLVGENKTIILDSNSEMARILQGIQ